MQHLISGSFASVDSRSVARVEDRAQILEDVLKHEKILQVGMGVVLRGCKLSLVHIAHARICHFLRP